MQLQLGGLLKRGLHVGGLELGVLQAGRQLRKGVTAVRSCHAAATPATATAVPSLPPCDFEPPPYQGPPISEILRVRKQHLSPALFTFYSKPLLLHAGHKQYLFDHEGRRYLDLFAGIVTTSLGHCHPKVIEATSTQMKTLWHTSNIYLNPTIHEYSQALVDTLPGDLKNIYLVNSGSEANDLALLMARLHTGRFDVVTLRNSYHGASPYTMGLTGSGKSKFPYPNGFGIHHVTNPDPYRGLWGGYRDSAVQSVRAGESELLENGSVCSSSVKYVGQLQDLLDYCVPQGKPAAFFAESIQGVGATVQYPLGYIKQAFELIRDRGGLCVSDEVQTGFGRTGTHFWGFEGHGVVPDIVTMAKGIGNGYPLAAVATTSEIASTMSKAFHFNTYGGNALGSAVGLAVLKTMLEENVQRLSHEIGSKFLEGLDKLRDEFDSVGDVRGKGLMLGMEMVETQATHNPMQADRMMRIFEHCRNLGLLLGKGGFHGNVFRIKPPMCLTEGDVTFALDVLKAALTVDRERQSGH
ncbi:Aminotransferase class-III [Trinorchestia longiramus]|nr:Aminotransferase class-III [Trinorchestia longiramus]